MAGVRGFFSQTVQLTASTNRTLCQMIAPSNQRLLLKKGSVSFNGITAADPPVLVELLIQTTAGTMSSLTPAKKTSTDDESLQATGQYAASAEPTASTVLWREFFHEQTGGPLNFPVDLPVPGGTRLGLRATPSTLTAATFAAFALEYEE